MGLHEFKKLLQDKRNGQQTGTIPYDKCRKRPASYLTEGYNIQCVYLQNIQGACGPINNWANGLNRFISKEEILMGNRHMEICPTALTIEK